jgi:ATP-dependent RNA helicase DeaD
MPAKSARTAASERVEPAKSAPTDFQEGRIEDEGFRAFGLSAPVLRALDALGFEAPTPIQEATIRLLLAGRDVIAQAQTGTGKTAAYGIPIVERADPKLRRPQALVLAPTRELAVQVAEALHELGKYRHLDVLPIYGGQPIERQLRGLRSGVHAVVGTPGRLLDHLRRGTLDLGAVLLCVLDEADEMLDMGFLEDVEAILAALREARGAEVAEPEAGAPEAPGERIQLALFSATIPEPVARLARRFLHEPERISVAPEQVTVPQITQVAYEVGGVDKLDALARILDVETPGSALVFCATRRTVDEVSERLTVRGYRAAALHGDRSQAERERVLRRFREGQVEVLVATDVAARGLDIEAITHVINYDIPWDPESYVHRIGRTGRAGRAGDAITLVTPRDYRQLRLIEQTLRQRIGRKHLPTLGDVAQRRREASKEAVAATIATGDLDPYLTLAGELGEQYDPFEVAAAALRLWDEARAAGAGEESTLAGALRAAAAEREIAAGRRGRRGAPEDRLAHEAAAEFQADGQAPEAGMARLLIAMGRVDGLRPQDLVGAIANEAGIPGRSIGAIDIYDRFSFVEVPAAQAEQVVEALQHTTIRGRRPGARLVQPGTPAPEERARAGPPRPRPRRPTRLVRKPARPRREAR